MAILQTTFDLQTLVCYSLSVLCHIMQLKSFVWLHRYPWVSYTAGNVNKLIL